MRFRKRNNNTYKKKKSLRRKHKNKQTRRRYKSRGGNEIKITKKNELIVKTQNELIVKKQKLENELTIIKHLLEFLTSLNQNYNALNTKLSKPILLDDGLTIFQKNIEDEIKLINTIKINLSNLDIFFSAEGVQLPLDIKNYIFNKTYSLRTHNYLDLQIQISEELNKKIEKKEIINNIFILLSDNNTKKDIDINILKKKILNIYNKDREEFQKYISRIVENVAKFYTKVNTQKTDLELQIESLEKKIKAINNVPENKIKAEELNNK